MTCAPILIGAMSFYWFGQALVQVMIAYLENVFDADYGRTCKLENPAKLSYLSGGHIIVSKTGRCRNQVAALSTHVLLWACVIVVIHRLYTRKRTVLQSSYWLILETVELILL